MRSVEWRYFSDLQWPLIKPNRPIVHILYPFSYRRSELRERLQIWYTEHRACLSAIAELLVNILSPWESAVNL